MTYTSRLRKAIREAATLERYVEYIREAATEPPNFGSRGARGPSREIGVVPFSFDIPANNLVIVSASGKSWTKLNPTIGTYADATLGGSVEKQRIGGFKPARLIYFESATRSVTTPISKRTGLEYQKYAGTTYTAPYGRGSGDGNDEYEVFMDLRSQLRPASYTGIRRVSRQVEIRKQRA
ncbi:hypothetical protein IQ268_11115 [Oculatella sp. LEGE 06141]|uniref:hypothetical protein n=1 Tax=Oculatella sp. LEGE 06141 TaxID=1828648 RepID=UPI0018804DF2|nr:hypothetical protein [Oculatella sp. LEGE 06141]MBE9179111.1 hypothetical protein [Oculatella sp. LEGE 06141]